MLRKRFDFCPSPSSRHPVTSVGLPVLTHRRHYRCPRVMNHTAREAGQDRRQDRPPRALCRLPDGRCRDPKGAVRRHPAPYRPAQTDASPGMTDGKLLRHANDRISAAGSSTKVPFPAVAARQRRSFHSDSSRFPGKFQPVCVSGCTESQSSAWETATWEIPGRWLTTPGAR